MSSRIKVSFILCVLLSFTSKVFAQSQEEGIKQMTKENYQTASHIFKSLIANSPKEADNYYYLGQCYLELNKQDSAKEVFDQGTQADPKTALCYVGTGEIYLNGNDVANAKKMFDQATSNSSSKDTKVLVAIAYAYANAEHNNYDQAIATLTKAATINSKDGSIYVAFGDVYFMENNGGLTVDNYDKAIELGKDVAKCNTKEGIIWTQALQYNQALPKFQEAIKTDSSYGPAYRGLAELYYITRQYQKAKDNYAKYLALADKNDYTKTEYAKILYLSGDYSDAVVVLKDVLTRDNTNSTLFRLLGYSYYHTNDYPDGITAMNSYFNVVKQDKIIDSDYIYDARLLSKNNSDSLAVLVYNKAILKDSADCSLKGELAGILYKDKKYVDAATAWQNDIKCMKDKAGLNEYFKLGLSYYFANQFGKADTVFKQAEKFNATWIQLPLFRARCNARIDTDMSLGTAKALYDSVLIMALKDSVTNKAIIMEVYMYDGYYTLQKDKDQKDFNVSLAYFNKVLAIDPNNATAKDAVEKINESIEEARKASQRPAPNQHK